MGVQDVWYPPQVPDAQETCYPVLWYVRLASSLGFWAWKGCRFEVEGFGENTGVGNGVQESEFEGWG